MQATLENYYTTRVLITTFVICKKLLAHGNISQRSAWMLLCSPAEVAPRPCGVTSLFTPDSEEPQGRLSCCAALSSTDTHSRHPQLSEKETEAEIDSQNRSEIMHRGSSLEKSADFLAIYNLTNRITTQRKFHLQVLFLLVFNSPRWQHVLTPPGPPCQPPLQQDRQHFQAFLSRTGSGNVTPWSNLDTIKPPCLVAPEDTPHLTTCACAKGPLDGDSKDAEAALELSQRRDVSQCSIYLYISLQRTAMPTCPQIFVCLGRGFQLHQFIAGWHPEIWFLERDNEVQDFLARSRNVSVTSWSLTIP